MKKKKIKIVVDTNIFVNPDSYTLWGHNSENAFYNFIKKIDKTSLEFYIPNSVYKELINFISEKIVRKYISSFIRKQPRRYELDIPALLFYKFIEEIRTRINKGLRVAEKYVRKALLDKDEQHIINNLRYEYREAMRDDIIDSTEDFDLILLAREINGYLCTSDKGLIKWAEKLGVSSLSPKELFEIINGEKSK